MQRLSQVPSRPFSERRSSRDDSQPPELKERHKDLKASELSQRCVTNHPQLAGKSHLLTMTGNQDDVKNSLGWFSRATSDSVVAQFEAFNAQFGSAASVPMPRSSAAERSAL